MKYFLEITKWNGNISSRVVSENDTQVYADEVLDTHDITDLSDYQVTDLENKLIRSYD